MNQDLRAVWETYVSAWKAVASTEKRAIFATCLAPSCVYTDPLTQAKGWDELLAYMLSFHQQVPGGHFVTEYFSAHHGRSIARWKMLNGEGQLLGEGTSYGEYDAEQRLVAMAGFFEAPGASAAA
ncbi:MAG TPA: nuclear transport factor 2 family protein [Polyangiaceae bacterium]|nr:nuclear transport factor 2 family protein [Polyangiaceae bacterium]